MPASLIEQLKAATPPATVTGLALQLKTAPEVPVPEVIARVTWSLLSVVTTLPEEPSTDTVTVNDDPAAELDGGSAVNASFEAASGDTVTVGEPARAVRVPPAVDFSTVAKAAVPAED